ncbi:MAG: Gfo/Idh/MocA family protein [Burkholderiales bacterium]
MSIGWALLGTGRHAVRNVLPEMKKAAGTRLVAVVSRDRARAEAFAKEHGFERGYGSLAEALRDPDVQALYHATPDGLHARDAIEGAKAGRHSLIEKPLALNLEEGKAVVAACHEHKVKLAVVFQQRHEAVHLEARRMVAAGEIGEVLMARAHLALRIPQPPAGAPVPLTWRNDPAMRSGGVLMSIGDHAFDTLSWIVGQEIVEIVAMSDATGPELPNEKIGSMLLKFGNGAVGYASASFKVPYAQRPIEIHGSKGSLILNNTYAYLTGASGDPRPSLEFRNESGCTVRYFPVSECFRLEIERFNRCIEGTDSPMTSGEEGLRAQIVTEAGYLALRHSCIRKIPK